MEKNKKNNTENYVIFHFDNGQKLTLYHFKIEDIKVDTAYQEIQYQDRVYLLDTKKITYIEEIKGNAIDVDELLRS